MPGIISQVLQVIKRVSNPDLMKLQDIVQDEVSRREAGKIQTKGEIHE